MLAVVLALMAKLVPVVGDSATLLEQANNIENFATRVEALCLVQRYCRLDQILPVLAVSASLAHEQGAEGLWLGLQARRIAALRIGGRWDDACKHALTLWERLDQGLVGIEFFPNVVAELCAVFVNRHEDLAQKITLRADAWTRRAASTLPALWRDCYLCKTPMR